MRSWAVTIMRCTETFGAPVSGLRATTSEVTCLGAGILAAVGAGWYADARAAAAGMARQAERYLPSPDTQRIYDRLYHDVYRTLFPTLQPAIDQLALLTHTLDEEAVITR